MATKKELIVADISKIKETLAEDPLIISGLKFGKEKYEEKIKSLKEIINSEDENITDSVRIKAKEAMMFYRTALSLEIPACGLTNMGGKPYINTAGLLYKSYEIAKNHGGVKSIKAIPHTISDDVSKPAFFIGRIEFGDGTIFEDIGEASVANVKMSTMRGFLNSMAARRATNRAMRLATCVGLVSIEEVGDEVNDGNKSIEEKLLNTKEMEQIMSIVADIESADNMALLDQLELNIPKYVDSLKLNELQIANIKKVIANKRKTLI